MILPLRTPPSPLPALVFPVAAAVISACADAPTPDPPPIPPETLAAEHEEWRTGRRNSLADPEGGVVSWIGLWELAEGPTWFGSDRTLAIVLPAKDSPPLAGKLDLAGGRVSLIPEPGSGITVRDGDPVTGPIDLQDDRSGNTTILDLGSLGMRIHAERGTDRLWLRAWDRDSPRTAAFELPPYFPITNEWRLSARFDPYPEPRGVPMADVKGGTVENIAPGELVFRAGGREHRLIAFATERSRDYLVMLRDSTAFADTYPLGRYMHVPFPDDDGWTVIDFNRAYNPPCAFTPFSVCSFPPRENRLALEVTAGEKRPEGPVYISIR
ncbi:MAG: DUF1684 domain-containing protein [Gemmatimonadota bacterium]|nr:DUF1684 domain-containing protein [Gemmatimonadota bacterium]